MKKAWVLYICVCLLLSACGYEKEVVNSSFAEPISYQEEQRARYVEPHGTKVYANDKGIWTELDGVRYSFPITVEQEQRDNLVKETAQFITRLKSATGCAVPERLSIVILEERYRPRVLDMTLYVGDEGLDYDAYFLGVAQAYLGMEIPYGLLYGLVADMGYIRTPQEVQDMFSLRQRCLLDLNYACFMERYAGEDLEKVQAISAAFYKNLSQDKRQLLWQEYDDETFYGLLNEYLKSNGQDVYENEDIWGIRIKSGGEWIRLCWQDDWATYYLQDNFKEISTETHDNVYGEDPFNTDYTDLRDHIIALRQQTLLTRNLLESHMRCEEERVDIVFTETSQYGADMSGRYDYAQNQVEIFNLQAVGHEYVHYLCRSMDIDYSLEHVICYYITYIIPGKMHGVCQYIEYMASQNESPYRERMDIARRYLGREVNLENKEDLWILVQCGVIDAKYKIALVLTEEVLEGYGQAKAAFASYLALQFGEDAMLEAVISESPQKLGYDTWEIAIEEWEKWLQDIFEG